MSDQTFHTTRQDLRKPESRVAHQHGGNPPADSNVSAMKSVIDKNTDKSKQVEETKANLPLPEQPPNASDWNSADQRTVNVGSGAVEAPVSGEGNSALREPATAGSSVRESGSELHKNTAPGKGVGRQGAEGLNNLPSDAQAR